MYDTHKDLLDALRAAPALLAALLRDHPAAQAGQGVGDGWSAVEVVCHLRDAEERALERMRLMRDEVDPFLAAYDQEAWAEERGYRAADLRQVLATFTRLRAHHVAELAALAPDEWERSGQHEEQGRITIASHTLHIVSHDMQHAAQLAQQPAASRTAGSAAPAA